MNTNSILELFNNKEKNERMGVNTNIFMEEREREREREKIACSNTFDTNIKMRITNKQINTYSLTHTHIYITHLGLFSLNEVKICSFVSTEMCD